MNTTLAYRTNDIVRYKDFLDSTRNVLVRSRGENKGKPCFDGVLVDDDGQATDLEVWGYDYQITKVWEMSDESNISR